MMTHLHNHIWHPNLFSIYIFPNRTSRHNVRYPKNFFCWDDANYGVFLDAKFIAPNISPKQVIARKLFKIKISISCSNRKPHANIYLLLKIKMEHHEIFP